MMTRMTFLVLLFSTYTVNADYVSNHRLIKSYKKKFLFRSLLSFELKVYESQSFFNGMEGASTAITASYKTRDVESLEKYGIVQFIKGCVFEDIEKSDGSTVRKLISRKFFGRRAKPFIHKDWEIDSVDEDPVYASISEENSRLGSYFWINEDLNPIYDKVKKHYYLNERPSRPELMISDLPSGGEIFNFSSYSKIQNSSLKFKICIYPLNKVPVQTVATNTKFASALKCFKWNSSHIYNKETQSFEKMTEIHPFCKETN